MASLGDAIASKMQAARDAAEAAKPEFQLDPEMELVIERMNRMRETSPREFADANFGGLRDRVRVYQNRKAEAERNNKR